jgi:hypothetical protein
MQKMFILKSSIGDQIYYVDFQISITLCILQNEEVLLS